MGGEIPLQGVIEQVKHPSVPMTEVFAGISVGSPNAYLA